MKTIKDIFQAFGPEYMTRFGDAMPGDHRKVINAIINCRTSQYGATIYTCEKCGQNHIIYRSCGNRHCPNCQHHKARQWLEKQIKRPIITINGWIHQFQYVTLILYFILYHFICLLPTFLYRSNSHRSVINNWIL